MVTIGGTNSATLSLQQSLIQIRATQAQREAESAAALARQRRPEADRTAEQAQGAPTTAAAQSKAPATARMDADVYASPRLARQSQVDPPTQEFLVRMYTAAADKFAAAGNPLKSDPDAAASKNTLGQTTGRILSLSA